MTAFEQMKNQKNMIKIFVEHVENPKPKPLVFKVRVEKPKKSRRRKIS